MGEMADDARDTQLGEDSNEQEEVEVVDEVIEQVQELSDEDIKDLAEENDRSERKGKMGVQSKSKLLEQLKKKKRHTLVVGGKSMLGKSILSHTLAKDLGFRLIETEGKAFYYKYNNQIQVETWDELKREVLNTREPMVIDSITIPYQDIMAVTPWEQSRFIIADMLMMVKHIKLFGGLIVAHGETKVIRNDDVGGQDNTVPQIEFKLEGNQRWIYRKTGLVIIGKHVLPTHRRLLFEGNFIPRSIYEMEMKKNQKTGEPIVSGKGYQYLKYLLGNSLEILIQKGSR